MAFTLDIVILLQYLFTALVIFRIFEYLVRLPHCGDVHRKYVLVTGCDGGFGRHLVRRLDSLGFRVFAGVATDEGEQQVQEGASVRVRPVRLDVRDPESIQTALRFVRAHLAADGLWGVVNCAETAGAGGYIDWLHRSDYQECWETNVLGLTDVITTFLPMVKKVKGRIIITSSVAGRIGFTGGAPYSMAMHAVEAFSDSLRKQLKIFDVKVVIMEPGLFKMNILGAARRNLWQTFRSAPDEVQQEYGDDFVKKLLRSDVDETLDLLISSDIDAAVDGYEHALISLFPRKRYSLGKQAKYGFIPISYLPSCFQDFLLSFNRPVPEIVKRSLEQTKESNIDANATGENDNQETATSDDNEKTENAKMPEVKVISNSNQVKVTSGVKPSESKILTDVCKVSTADDEEEDVTVHAKEDTVGSVDVDDFGDDTIMHSY